MSLVGTRPPTLDEWEKSDFDSKYYSKQMKKGLCFIYKYTFIFDLKTALSIFMP